MFDFEDDDSGTLFRDIITLALAGFVAIVFLILPHINPPTKKQDAEVLSPGNVIVEIRWPDPLDVDVDLWVKAPGDVPGGYSAKSGRIFNLLRDDLGHSFDATGLNYEVAFARGMPAGEYVVNVHLYRNVYTNPPVIPVTVAISTRTDAGVVSLILSKRVQLHRVGQELTVFRFRLDESGQLVRESVHDIPKPLRATPPP